MNKTNKESSSRIVISTPIIESPVWSSSLRVDFVVCCVLITELSVSIVQVKSGVAVQTGNSVVGSRSHNMPDFVVDEMSVLFPDKEGKH